MRVRISRLIFNALLALGFLLSYRFAGIDVATVVLMGGVWLEVLCTYAVTRHVSAFELSGLLLVTGLGSATLIFGDVLYLEWRPTIFYWLCALGLAAYRFTRGRNPIAQLLGGLIEVQQRVWSQILAGVLALLVTLGVMNLVVAYRYSLDTWVTWRVFGAPAVIALFGVAMLVWRRQDVRNSWRNAGRRHQDAPPPPMADRELG